MTDIMKLADAYAECMYLRREKHEARSTLQSAIEALQAENERLKREIQNQYRCIESHAKITQKAEAERYALQAKLDAMGKGAYDDTSCAGMPPNRVMERAYGLCPTDMPHLRRMAWIADYFLRNYAAPKALAPLTDEQLRQMRTDARASEDCANEYWFMLFARAIEAAHGIGGTP